MKFFLQGNLQRKSELNNETFKSLASDKPDFQKDSSNTGSRVIQETVGALAKPMSERKVVIRIKFAQVPCSPLTPTQFSYSKT